MTISSTLSTSSSTATSTAKTSTSSASASTATAYNTFLTLLTTELKNQNPLDPTNTSEFTSELISLSGIEQQQQTNSTLNNVLSTLSAMNMSNGIAYIGKTVEASGDTAPIQNGSANWNYSLDSAADSVTLTVADSSGNTVYSGTGDTSAGKHSFSWDGKGSDGTSYTSGDYTLTVTAKDSSGSTVSSSTTALGTITSVDSSSGSATLNMGGVSVALSDVTSVKN